MSDECEPFDDLECTVTPVNDLYQELTRECISCDRAFQFYYGWVKDNVRVKQVERTEHVIVGLILLCIVLVTVLAWWLSS